MEHAAAACDVPRGLRGYETMAAGSTPRVAQAGTIGMTTDVVAATLRSSLARPALRARLKLEHLVMGGAIVALIVLVVLPLVWLLLGSVKGEQGLSLEHFSEVLSGRLYLTALKNSLILGAWTALFSLVIGLVLAFAVGRTDVPGEAADPAHSHALLPVAAVSHVPSPSIYLFSPNAGLINVLMRDVPGCPGSPSIFSP